MAARLMPVLPEVGSTSPRCPPYFAPRLQIAQHLPGGTVFDRANGFIHSSLEYSGNSGAGFSRLRRTSGVGFSSSGIISKTFSYMRSLWSILIHHKTRGGNYKADRRCTLKHHTEAQYLCSRTRL